MTAVTSSSMSLSSSSSSSVTATAAANSSATTTTTTTTTLTDYTKVREWLSTPHHAKPLALLDQFEMELRLGRLGNINSGNVGSSSSSSSIIGTSTPYENSSSSSNTNTNTSSSKDRRAVTVRTVTLAKILIGSTRWKTPAELFQLLKGLGRELQLAGGVREPAIGNVVRRILAAVREEVLMNNASTNTNISTTDTNGIGSNATNASTKATIEGSTGSGTSKTTTTSHSLESMLWALPQHVKPIRTRPNHQRSESLSENTVSSNSNSNSVNAAITTSSSTTATTWLPPAFFQPQPNLKQSVMEAIQELSSDLEDLHKNINDQVTHHIHAGEIILTYGSSQTVKHFLKAAVDKKLRFTVVLCEGAPHYEGHDMANFLATAGIECVCIPDAAIFAMMARVNKVLLPAHAVLANGGLVAPSGCNLVALAAAQNSVPVVCLTGMFKLTPLFPHEHQDTLNDLLAPSGIMEQQQTSAGGRFYSLDDTKSSSCLPSSGIEMMPSPTTADDVNDMPIVDIVNPVHDYIQPSHVNLYVTNVGSFQPSYIYRLLAEYYHSDDWDAFS